MRKAIATAIAVGLLAGAFIAPAEAGKKKAKPRTVEAPYQAPSIGALGAGVCSPGTIGCIGFPAGATERFVMVEVTDTLPTAVYASVTQDLNGDAQADTSTGICGASTEPIAIEPGYEVTVFIWEGPGPSPVCPGGASSGTIKVTFSATP